eukprot:scaffold74720_cov33-Attheya_sp.AAC.2
MSGCAPSSDCGPWPRLDTKPGFRQNSVAALPFCYSPTDRRSRSMQPERTNTLNMLGCPPSLDLAATVNLAAAAMFGCSWMLMDGVYRWDGGGELGRQARTTFTVVSILLVAVSV